MINTKRMIAYDEGKRLKVYRCTEGFKTVGIGCNLDANPHMSILKRTLKVGDYITEKECDLLFAFDYSNVINSINQRMHYFSDLLPNYQVVLINMVYQMGIRGVLKFPSMLKAMQAKDTAKIIEEMKDSVWYHQTPERAWRLISIITGTIPKEYL